MQADAGAPAGRQGCRVRLPVTARGARTIVLAVAGGFGASLLGLPLPYLFGPLALAAVSGIAGHPVADLPRWGQSVTRVVVGILIGSSVSPDTLGRLGEFAVSAAVVPVQAALVTGIAALLVRRVVGVGWNLALLGAVPGGLFTIVMALQGRESLLSRVGLVHTMRVALVVTVVPLALTWGLVVGEGESPATGIAGMGVEQVAWFLGLAAVGFGVVRLVRFPGSEVMLPMMLTAAVQLSGVGSTAPPYELVALAQLVLGTSIGAGFRRISGREAGRWALAGIGVAMIGMAGMVATAWMLGHLIDLPWSAGLLAFAPGGVAEMSVAALVLGVDPGYVAAIHVWRLVLVVSAVPLMLRLLGDLEPDREPAP